MIQLNEQIVKQVYADMARKYNATIFRQEDVEHIIELIEPLKSINQLLRAFGVWSPSEHLEKWAITLGRFVCVPWTPGEGNLVRQLDILCHELTHVEQWRTDEFFAVNYTTSRSKRAHHEVLAMQAELESHKILTGRMLGIDDMTSKLSSAYYCRMSDAKVAYASLNAYSKVVEQGAIGSPIVKDMIKMLG